MRNYYLKSIFLIFLISVAPASQRTTGLNEFILSLTGAVYLKNNSPSAIETSLANILTTNEVERSIRGPNLQVVKDLRVNEVLSNWITVDDSGNSFVVGGFSTISEYQGKQDLFISKINDEGVIEDIYFDGGQGFAQLLRIDLDSQGNVFATGYSNNPYLKVNDDSFQYYSGGQDNYILSLTNDLEYRWSSYVGGIYSEFGGSLGLDNQDNPYLLGLTSSFNYPTKNGIIQTHPGGFTGTITKFANSGTMTWSTFLNDWIFSGLTPLTDNEVAIYTRGGELFTLNFETQEIGWSTLIKMSDPCGTEGSLAKADNIGNIYLLGVANWCNSEIIPDYPLLNPIDSEFDGSSDIYLTKISSNGTMLWSTLLGGNSTEWSDWFQDLVFDNDNNPIIVGTTESLDFPVTDDSFHHGSRDIYMMKVASDGSQILSSSLFGGSGFDDIASVSYVSENEIYIHMNTFSDSIFYGSTELSSNYPFNFGEEKFGILINFDLENMGVNWVTKTLGIPERNSDYDEDGLSNQLEYDLCMKGPAENRKCIDPLSPDSDGDGIYDGYEFEFGLQILRNDSHIDSDGDGLSNLKEFEFGTWSNSSDSDNDGMNDLYEFNHGLNGIENDLEEDKDGDGMPNGFEYENNFNPNDGTDANGDADNDGLTNLEEYKIQSNPLQSDSDLDGMPDKWEEDNGLDPTTNDSGEDKDGDGISNKFEYDRNWDPNSKKELIYAGLIISSILMVTLIGGIIYYRSKKKNEAEAVNEGWDNYEQKKKSRKLGFDTSNKMKQAKANGFLSAASVEIMKNEGLTNEAEVISQWKLVKTNATAFISSKDINRAFEHIKISNSPDKLLRAETQYKSVVTEINQHMSNLERTRQIQEHLIKINQMLKIDTLVKTKEADIQNYINNFSKLFNQLHQAKSNLENEFKAKRAWLEPWQQLLTLIQITEDGAPISLEKIVEVTNTNNTQAETLLIELLEENSQIGTYDRSNKEYIKGENIQNYLNEAIKLSEKLHKE